MGSRESAAPTPQSSAYSLRDAGIELDKTIDNEHRNSLLSDTIARGMADDPEACLSFLQTNLEGDERVRWLGEAILLHAETHPADAAEFCVKYLHGGRDEDVFAEVAAQWAQEEPEKAADWAAIFLALSPENAVYPATVSAWAEQDPAAAMEHLNKQSHLDDRAFGVIVANVAETFAIKDPEAASMWAVQQQEANGMGNPLDVVFTVWADENAASAAWFAERKLPTAMHPEVFSTIGSVWADSNPEAAIGWAMRLDGPARMDALLGAFGSAAADKVDVEKELSMLPAAEATQVREHVRTIISENAALEAGEEREGAEDEKNAGLGSTSTY